MRIAAIQYINALPLTYGLKSNPSVELLMDTPSGCYQRLIQGEVDLALVPVIALQKNPALRALKGLGIAATTKTESVFLFTKKPLDRIQTITVDSGSLTSVMLLRIILKEKYRNEAQLQPQSIQNIHEVLRQSDAALLIGDDAILAEKTDYDHYDLATEWYSIYRLPFVFAVWTTMREVTYEEKAILNDSYRIATQNWENIYAEAVRMLPVDSTFVKRYYNENLHYQLTKKDYEGILKFITISANLGLLESIRKDIWA
jgi:chorismate dehydratase